MTILCEGGSDGCHHVPPRSEPVGLILNGKDNSMSQAMTNEIASTQKSSEPANVNGDHQAIEALAYQLWVLRGRPIGAPAVDWVPAEEELSNAMNSVRRAT